MKYLRSPAASSFFRAVSALVLAFVVGGVVIAVTQKSLAAPFPAYAALFTGSIGTPDAWANTLQRTMPILLTGLAVSVALAAGLFNIGAEGQMAVGALAAAVCGSSLGFLPSWVLLPLSLIIGMASGAAWAFLPAYLKIKRGTHEVITAILLNYIAQIVTRFLAAGPWKDPASPAPQTAPVAAVLPRLLPGYDVHAGLLFALVLAPLLWLALRRTVWGYETRATGQGADAARASGIPTDRIRIHAMLLSGALAGLAGGVLVLGESPFRRFPADLYGVGYGFDGLAVALLAGGSPLLCVPCALLFGGLSAGADNLAFVTGIPKQVAGVVQAVLIVAVAVRVLPRFKLRGRARA